MERRKHETRYEIYGSHAPSTPPCNAEDKVDDAEDGNECAEECFESVHDLIGTLQI